MLGIFNRLSRSQLERACEQLRELAEKQKVEIVKKDNHITILAQNARKWASKFREPTYAVPEKVIREMEEEAEQYKERTRAELTRVRAQKAELVHRLVDMQISRSDNFGSKVGDADVSFDLVGSHEESMVTEEDRHIVDEEILEAVEKKISKFARKL